MRLIICYKEGIEEKIFLTMQAASKYVGVSTYDLDKSIKTGIPIDGIYTYYKNKNRYQILYINNKNGTNGIYKQIHSLSAATNIPVTKILDMIDEGYEFKGYTVDIIF